MAEKITLVELDIDIDKAIKDTKTLTEEVELLKAQTKAAKEQQGELSEEYIQYSSTLKVAQKELNQQKRLTEEVIAADNAQSGSIEQLRRQLSVVTIEWKNLSKEERENSERGKALSKQKLDLTNQLKKEEAAVGDNRRNVGNYTESIKEAAGSLGIFGDAAGKAMRGMQLLGIGIQALTGPFGIVIIIIGLIVSALKSFFTSSEEGQNKAKELGAIFKTVFGNIMDLMSKLGEALMHPKQALQDLRDFFENTFGNILVGIIQNSVATIILGFNKLNLAWQNFKNVFTDNAEGIAKAQEEINETEEKREKARERFQKGIENTVDAYKKLKQAVIDQIEENKREIAIAQELERRTAALTAAKREQLVLNAKNRNEIAELRRASKDLTLSDEERIAAITKANQIQEEQLKIAQRLAWENYQIIKSQNELSNSTIEDKEKEAKALADYYNIQAENNEKLVGLSRERQRIENEIAAARQKQIDEEIKRQEALVQAERDLMQKHLDDSLTARAMELDAEYAINKDNVSKIIELEKEKLRQQEIQEIAAAEKIGADVSLIREKYRKADEELDRASNEAKLSLASDFFGNLETIFGENTKIGKAAAVAQATVDTYKGATSAYASLAPIPVVGPALGATAASAAIAAGIANVKNILKTKSGLKGDSGGISGTSTPSSTASPRTSNVNPSIGQGIVTRDGETARSLADSIKNTDANRNVLVEDDVTNKQKQKETINNAAVV